MFICMATILDLKLDAQKNLNITKVLSKLNDWITEKMTRRLKISYI